MIEVLGGSEKFHAKCLQQYIDLFNFSQITIIEATRIVFSTFLMTGGTLFHTIIQTNHFYILESQQVLRILEAFSTSYFENNKVVLFILFYFVS